VDWAPTSARSKTFYNKIRKQKIIGGKSKNYCNFSAISAMYFNIGYALVQPRMLTEKRGPQRTQIYLDRLLSVETRLQYPLELNSKGDDYFTTISG